MGEPRIIEAAHEGRQIDVMQEFESLPPDFVIGMLAGLVAVVAQGDRGEVRGFHACPTVATGVCGFCLVPAQEAGQGADPGEVAPVTGWAAAPRAGGTAFRPLPVNCEVQRAGVHWPQPWYPVQYGQSHVMPGMGDSTTLAPPQVGHWPRYFDLTGTRTSGTRRPV
ncbi:MAG TPA: hypothetical protein VGG62_10635 [Terracidiphilus sp.]